MDSAFNEQILADKLSKLNSTQQCIETLSHWCIFHRKHAEQVIQTWDKQFHNSQKEQKIPFLYLANDILQNSRRNGTEFVSEFWKVLPAALKEVLENGDDNGKNVVSRLIDIWEQRRVFGSRAQSLKEVMLCSQPLPSLELNKKRPRSSVRILKRDSRSIRVKLSIGGTAEKIISALHNVLSEHSTEEIELNKCKAALHHVGKLEKDVQNACIREGDSNREPLTKELQEEEATLNQCIEKLKLVEANRVALVDQLKESLNEQESELENVRTQLQLAQAMIEESANMRRRLNREAVAMPSNKATSNGPSANVAKKSAAAIAAEVADKLAASTHSQQIMTSVLSSFAAEAAKGAGLAASIDACTSLPEAPPNKKMKNEKPIAVLDTSGTTFVPLQPTVVTTQLQPQGVIMQQATMQNQASAPLTPYNMYATPTQQYLQPSGGVMIGPPYTYSTLPLPPPPPQPQPHMMNVARQSPLVQQPTQQSLALLQQPPPPPQLAVNQPMLINQPSQFAIQQPAPPSYRPLQPPGMAFYHPPNH